MSDNDFRELRDAFGRFTTGVTIVTTSDMNGDPIGVTANSFTSVSLEPPMILWSLATEALSSSVFQRAGYFCVHVLTTSQRELSEQFARRGEDKFSGVPWSSGPKSIPLLNEYVARFLCRSAGQHPVGDHVVFVGEVMSYDHTDARPLVFHGGRYALAERRRIEEVAVEVGAQQSYPGDRRKR